MSIIPGPFAVRLRNGHGRFFVKFGDNTLRMGKQGTTSPKGLDTDAVGEWRVCQITLFKLKMRCIAELPWEVVMQRFLLVDNQESRL